MIESGFSKNLQRTIGDENKGIDALMNLGNKVEELLNQPSCDKDALSAIFNKQDGLFNLLQEIIDIGSRYGASVKDKKEALHKLLGDEKVQYILGDIEKEIKEVESGLKRKGKEAAKAVMEAVSKAGEQYGKLYTTAIGLEELKISKARANEKDLEAGANKEGLEDVVSLQRYEKKGFWAKFKVERENGKGIFASLTGAFKSGKNIQEDPQVSSEKISREDAIERLVKMDEEISECQKRIYELKKEQQKLYKLLLKEGEKEITVIKNKTNSRMKLIVEKEIPERFAKLKKEIEERKKQIVENRAQKAEEKAQRAEEKAREAEAERQSLEKVKAAAAEAEAREAEEKRARQEAERKLAQKAREAEAKRKVEKKAQKVEGKAQSAENKAEAFRAKAKEIKDRRDELTASNSSLKINSDYDKNKISRAKKIIREARKARVRYTLDTLKNKILMATNEIKNQPLEFQSKVAAGRVRQYEQTSARHHEKAEKIRGDGGISR